ncbi:MAG: proprotein convertase P-domain-containing protein, partial [Gammaproteobacteria bacterium]
KDDAVESAENDLNHRLTTYQYQTPNDPSYIKQWHLHNRLDDPAFDGRASARCEDAWRALDHFGSFDVVVGVTDDGCRIDHPDFNSQGKFAGWGYFRGSRLIVREDIDAVGSEMYKEGANHGTSCAGVIAGEADSVLTVGAAPGCRLLPIQWESDGDFLQISESKLLTALNYLQDKVDVLSNSWGGAPTTLWPAAVINKITQLATRGGRRGKGIVFLWAAGNENCPIQHDASFDVPYDQGWQQNADGSWSWVGVTTARRFRNNLVGIPGLMHVAALASTAQRSHYSNYGTGIGVCAPSSNSHEYFRLTVTGLGITTTTGAGSGVTASFGGTSSATPLVAGIAALVVSANPKLSAADIVSLLKRTAAKNLNMNGYRKTPPASFDRNPNWDVSPVAPFDSGEFVDTGSADGSWSPWFGHGRVDAAAAVIEALRLAGGTSTDRTYRKTSVPMLRIPDNNAVGVNDVILFGDNVAIGSVKVSVDITHSYIGDLKVSLSAPNGRTVVLHDRNGGGSDNLRKTYDAAAVPELAGLKGQSVQGEWRLQVQDLAQGDVGVLNRWEIEAAGQTDTAVQVEEAPGATIPDDNPAGIERLLSVANDGTVAAVSVAVDITHSYIGDLAVTLIAPGGDSVVLHDRSGGSLDNIIKTYTVATTPALAALRGKPMHGVWRLKLVDLFAKDIGKLNRWTLRIEPESGS